MDEIAKERLSGNSDSNPRVEVTRYLKALEDGVALAAQSSLPTRALIKCLLILFATCFRCRIGLGSFRASNSRDKSDVHARYQSLASKYEQKHALTTNGRDIWWRREVGYYASSFLKDRFSSGAAKPALLVDLCSGTGLSLEEMFRVFYLENATVMAVGIEISEAMLSRSTNETLPRIRNNGWITPEIRELQFLRGDAYRLASGKEDDELATFAENSVSCITSVLGVCGLKDAIRSFAEQLKVLEPGGIVIVLDVHRPFFLPSNSESKQPTFLEIFQQFAWDKVTVPLVLNRFWAWEDPTATFNTAPFLTMQSDKDGKFYGFKLKFRQFRTEAWWFGLPLMPVAVMILQKVEINESEARRRNQLFAQIKSRFQAAKNVGF